MISNRLGMACIRQLLQWTFCCVMPAVVPLSATASLTTPWPTGTVRIVVPYPAGSEPDVIARDLGGLISRESGRQFLIENRPGSNSISGTAEVVDGANDGSVLLLVDRRGTVANSLLYKSIPYDWMRSLKPVTDVASASLFIAVRRNLPVDNYADFVRYAREHPYTITVGTGGYGHISHIGMARLAQLHKLSFTFVRYRGLAPAVQDLQAGSIDAVLAGGHVIRPLVAGQRIRVLAHGADERSLAMPDVPSLREAGGVPGSIPTAVFSLMVPSQVPTSVAEQIGSVVTRVLGTDAIRKRYRSMGLNVVVSTPSETLAQMREDNGYQRRLFRDIGLVAN